MTVNRVPRSYHLGTLSREQRWRGFNGKTLVIDSPRVQLGITHFCKIVNTFTIKKSWERELRKCLHSVRREQMLVATKYLHTKKQESAVLARAESRPTDRKAQAFTFKFTMPNPPWQGFKNPVSRRAQDVLFQTTNY